MPCFRNKRAPTAPFSEEKSKTRTEKQPYDDFPTLSDRERRDPHFHAYSPTPKGYNRSLLSKEPPHPSSTKRIRPRPLRFAPSSQWNPCPSNRLTPPLCSRKRIFNFVKRYWRGTPLEDVFVDKCGYCLEHCRRMPGGWLYCEGCVRAGITVDSSPRKEKESGSSLVAAKNEGRSAGV